LHMTVLRYFTIYFKMLKTFKDKSKESAKQSL